MDNQFKEELSIFGTNIELTSKIASFLNLGTRDFKDERRFEKVKDIIAFAVHYPDPMFMFQKAIGSKNLDRVDFLHEYIHLYRELKSSEAIKNDIKEKLDLFMDNQSPKYTELLGELDKTDQKITELQNTIQVYEK